VNCEPGFITRAKFAEYCRCTHWKDREAEWSEVAAYGAFEAALATLPGYLFDSLLFTLIVALSGSLALLSLWCLGTPGIRSTTSLS
jgi:hypothetical protein